MDASSLAKGGVQPSTSDVKNTGVTGRLEKLHRLHLLKQRYRELTHELARAQAELFGRGQL